MYYKQINLFFINFNFNIGEFSKLVKDDFAFCEVSNSHLMVASIDFSTKVIFNVLNMVPSEIQEINDGAVKYYAITKGSTNIYYALSGDYILISDSHNFFSSNENISDDLYKMCFEDDIYFKQEIKDDYNKYEAFPSVSSVALKINSKNGKTEIKAKPNGDVKFAGNLDKDDFEILKLFPLDFPLSYYNNDYKVNETINKILGSSRINPQSEDFINAAKDDGIIESYSNKIFFGFNNFVSVKGRSGITPEISLVLSNKKSDLPFDEKKKNLEKFKSLINTIFGTTGWKDTSDKNNTYILSNAVNNEMNMISYKKFIIITNGDRFTQNIIGQIINPKPSSYDKFYNLISNEKNLAFFSFVNLDTLFSTLEPQFNSYLFSYAKMDSSEYEQSYGQFVKFIKERKSMSIKLFYDQKEKIYYGNSEFID